MISLIIDTSVLRNDPARRRPDFESISNLSQKKLIKIYIPQIVKSEFITGRRDDAEEAFQKALSSLKKAKSKSVSANLADRIQEIKDLFSDVADVNRTEVETEFNEWIERNFVKVVDVDPSCLPEVLSNYFNGGPAFKHPKRREDFPDSFIYQTIKKILDENPTETFLIAVNDNNLRKHISELPGVKVFSDLQSLIISTDIQQILMEEAVFLQSDEIKDELIEKRSELIKYVDDPLNFEIEHQEVYIFQEDGEESETTISEVNNINNVKTNFANFNYYGNNVFTLPFTSYATVWLDYAIFKANLWVLPDEEQDNIHVSDSEWNEHYIWVNEKRIVEVTGKIAIKVDSEKLRLNGIENLNFEDGSFEVEKVDIEEISPMERDFKI